MSEQRLLLVAGLEAIELAELAASVTLLPNPPLIRALTSRDSGRLVGELVQAVLDGEAPARDAEPLPSKHPLLFFARVPRELITPLIAFYKTAIERRSIFAGFTPTNAGWTVQALVDDLTREHDFFLAREAEEGEGPA